MLQLLPQPPQFVPGSRTGSPPHHQAQRPVIGVHADVGPPQRAWPLGQFTVPQVPLVHAWPLPHATLHPPQLAVVLSWVSQPLAVVQSPKPVLQAPIVHTPVLLHVAAALAKLHAMLQPPQSVSVVVERSQPLPGRPSQSAKPALHAVMLQPEPVHVAMATLGKVVQLLFMPQPPQVSGALMLASQPLPT